MRNSATKTHQHKPRLKGFSLAACSRHSLIVAALRILTAELSTSVLSASINQSFSLKGRESRCTKTCQPLYSLMAAQVPSLGGTRLPARPPGRNTHGSSYPLKPHEVLMGTLEKVAERLQFSSSSLGSVTGSSGEII